MKITVLQQCARGLRQSDADDTVPDATAEESLERCLESVKHYLWHGNSIRALDRLQDVVEALDERYRNGEQISTSFTESEINQVVNKFMVKQQQMQWTPEGAHLLLQVRIQVLNDDWADIF